jgi:hypothetical protein
MDFISHILIGLLIANIFNLSLIPLLLLVIGSVFSDISVIPIYFYYKDKKWLNLAWRDYEKNKGSRVIFKVYDFTHSILFVLIILLLSLYFPVIIYFMFGLILHILIDILLHKPSPEIFFPFKIKLKGFANWFDLYGSIISRLIIWIILIILNLVVYLFRLSII